MTKKLKGTVKNFGHSYGFIKPEGEDEDVFVHISNTPDQKGLQEGERVEFEVEETMKGPKAVNVVILTEEAEAEEETEEVIEEAEE